MTLGITPEEIPEEFEVFRDIEVSFELFPPRSSEMEEQLWGEIKRLEPLAPRFVSVTYGAGGSTRDRSAAILGRIRSQTSLDPAAHLTCVGATRDEVDEVAESFWHAGVHHIVALRGDPPGGAAEYQPHPGGYAYAADLVAGLKRVADFEISVAAYPEVHPEAVSAAQDLDNLKRKLDAGACRAITQFFFDPASYLRFVERARAAGIDAPIVAGILPITNFARTVEFARKCGATVPEWMAALFSGLQDDPDTRSRRGRGRAMPPADRPGGEGVPLLHAEPGRFDHGDLPNPQNPGTGHRRRPRTAARVRGQGPGLT
jgi:methylenetetrahydrofolate reductase (NADPH)